MLNTHQLGDLISFQIGPVQPYIEAARTLRDLWSGSYLLSWLTAHAVRAATQHEAEILVPDVSGNPVVAAVNEQKVAGRMTPCLPNRFVARVPAGQGKPVATAIKKAVQTEFEAIARAVHDHLTRFIRDPANWDRDWKGQIEHFWEIRAAVLPEAECQPAKLRSLGITATEAGWPELDLLAGLMDARRSVKHVPDYHANADESVAGRRTYPPKCSLFGSFEQMGPGDVEASAAFWRGVAERSRGQLRRRDRFCAISLVKRFAWPAYFQDRLGEKLRFQDTPTLAASAWLADEPAIDPEKITNWDGDWLHVACRVPGPDDDSSECPENVWKQIHIKKKQATPPKYFAVLMADGDRLGKLLLGEKADAWGSGAERLRSVSAALSKYALEQVGSIVEMHHGTLIYSGGDDTLAVLPLREAFACAGELNKKYREAMKGETLSGGLAVVHYHEDLRESLAAARAAEKLAKNAGRNCLGLSICPRSGGHQTAIVGWDHLPSLQALIHEYWNENVSDRWAYRLRAELPALVGEEVPCEMILAEIRRLIRQLDNASAIEQLATSLWQLFFNFAQTRGQKLKALEWYVTACLAAGFAAPGGVE